MSSGRVPEPPHPIASPVTARTDAMMSVFILLSSDCVHLDRTSACPVPHCCGDDPVVRSAATKRVEAMAAAVGFLGRLRSRRSN